MYSEHLNLTEASLLIKEGLLVQGVIRGLSTTFKAAFVITEDGQEFFVNSPQGLNRSLHGDHVAVKITGSQEGPLGKPQTLCEVVAILERGEAWLNPQIGYFVFKSRHLDFQLLRTFDKRIPWVRVPTRLLRGLSDRDLKFDAFEIKLSGWSVASSSPHTEEQVQLIGSKNSQETLERISLSVQALRHLLNPTPHMTPPLLDPTPVRVDLTDRIAVSIDPPHAHEIDDALHCRALDGGGFEVGVHIADVWAYLKPGSAPDIQARARHQTLYLRRRSHPLFPPEVAQVASLSPGAPRPALSVIFIFDRDRNLITYTVQRTLIQVCAQLTYQSAEELARGEHDRQQSDIRLNSGLRETLRETLCELRALAQVLRDQRPHVSLLRSELEWELDSWGQPTRFTPKAKRWTHFMVEEWMVWANHTFARVALSTSKSVLLRVHEGAQGPQLRSLKPSLVNLLSRVSSDFTSSEGPLTSSEESIPRQLARLTYPQISDLREPLRETLIETLSDHLSGAAASVMITQASARYQTAHTARDFMTHIGVGLHPYTHATSPLRRYADVIVHAQVINALPRDQHTVGLDDYLESLDSKIDRDLTRTSTAMRHMHEWIRAPMLALNLFSSRSSRMMKVVICGLTARSVMLGFYEHGVYQQIKRPEHLELKPLQLWNARVSNKHKEITELEVELVSQRLDLEL